MRVDFRGAETFHASFAGVDIEAGVTDCRVCIALLFERHRALQRARGSRCAFPNETPPVPPLPPDAWRTKLAQMNTSGNSKAVYREQLGSF